VFGVTIGDRQQEGGAMHHVGWRQSRVPFLLPEHRAWKVLVLELPHDRFHSVFQLQFAFLERGFFEQFGFG
jgi:hypothetical protein